VSDLTNGTTKPEVIQPNYDAAPAEMREKRIWLIWEYVWIEPKNGTAGRWSKEPLIAQANYAHALTNKPETWRSFEDACRFSIMASGIGAVMKDDYCGVDLDNCREPKTGAIAPWAQRIIDLLNSYSEVSPSGTGVRIFVRLTAPLREGGRKKRGGKELGWAIEVYDRTSPRYLTVTGVVVLDQPVRLLNPEEFYPAFERGDLDAPNTNGNGKPKGKPEFSREQKKAGLMAGNWESLGYGTQSEADYALVAFLAGECDGDPEKIDAAFRESGLMRSKWDEQRNGETYGSRTIKKFLENRRPSTQLITTQKGTPTACLANAATMLRISEEWQDVLAYNEFSSRTVTHKPTPWQKPAGTEWTDFDDGKFCEWLQQNGVGVRTNVAAEAVQIVAQENPFHPVRDYLKSLAWDGTPRIEKLLPTYFGAKDVPYIRAVGQCWLRSAVARVMRPGCQADYTLLLLGPQGILKSQALRTLASNSDWFTDHIADLINKDSREGIRGKWIVELAELGKIKGRHAEQVKGFLTCQIDRYRPAYGRRSIDFPRSCVFAASANDDTPLTDETGNRRFWPVTCGVIDVEGLKRDRDQLWAEAYASYSKGEPSWLGTKELNDLATLEQDKHYEPGVYDELIEAWIQDPKARKPTDFELDQGVPLPVLVSEAGSVTTTDILIHCLDKTVSRLEQKDMNTVARCLTHLKWKRKQVYDPATKRSSWRYMAPAGWYSPYDPTTKKQEDAMREVLDPDTTVKLTKLPHQEDLPGIKKPEQTDI
jgi:predicted P-loop ATPase